MIFIRVDLPAPFSPSTAWISPGFTRRLTRSFALTAGYCLLMLASSRRSMSAHLARVAHHTIDQRCHEVPLIRQGHPCEHLLMQAARHVEPALRDGAVRPVPHAHVGGATSGQRADLVGQAERRRG